MAAEATLKGGAGGADQECVGITDWAFLERRYNVRIRAVRDLSERALILRQRQLVIIDDQLSASDAERLISRLATQPSRAH